ncbi:universal stress protein family [Geomicrobium sp. JCM 19037]|uniref:universal stress protein n=1 Tax=Geomicrobium sp. JCM 19037 TaxID=1460634 RepID=UPI00045F2483|nr:universal stress protein [Geomicrobium sp. JCM 19037]GAK03340.1 universal stress protein family [Geomicrobium sp. JCM 19037]
MSYERVLLCIDGEETPSNDAYKHAIRFARQNNATLYLCTVINPKPYGTLARFDRYVVDKVKKAAQIKLEQFLLHTQAEGVSSQTILETGVPSIKISKQIVPAYNIDLIVAGATGGTKLEKALQGSVTSAIIKKAKCDVFVVRTEERERASV